MTFVQEAAITFTVLCLLSCTFFLGWIIWNLVWEGYDAFMRELEKRNMRIPYHKVNDHRITPRFDVGSDVKGVK